MRSTQYKNKLAILCLLLTLFILRVGGQLLVANGLAPYLPPMHEWQSGLLAYPVLVVFQFLIVGLFAKVICDLALYRGYFFEKQNRLKKSLKLLGLTYLTAMVMRYIIYMYMVPEARFFHGTIPIIFHIVLASFIITYASMTVKIPEKHMAT